MTSHKSSDAIVSLLAPDGYYTYLKVPKGVPSKDNPDETTIDEDLIKKNYRKLSLKHHPDKPGGDDETFRILNRAQKVLMNPKLRKQYDILGIDLDDDEEHEENDADQDKEAAPSTAQGIVQEIAGMVIAFLIQLTVRTMMMGAVSVLLVRYRWTVYPALAFLVYIAFRIVQTSQRAGGSLTDVVSPFAIAAGLLLMHNSIRASWVFFWGEALVIFMFTYNSSSLPKNALIYAGMAVLSMLAALWFRGYFWNYVTVVVLEAVLALLAALAFPVMELVLDAILNEKLKKVGAKVRHHHAMLEKYYQTKMEESND